MPSSSPNLRSDQPTGNESDPFRGTPYRAVVCLQPTNSLTDSFVVAHRVTGRQFLARLQAADLVRNREVAERMRIDAQALGCLNHANVVAAVSAGSTSDGRFYVVTEYPEGRSLADELEERKRIPFLEAVAYTCDLLSALSAAHALGIVHRDTTPSSVLVCTQPNARPHLKLANFLAARVAPNAPDRAPAPLSPATDPQIILGVPLFVSPELVARGTSDARSDIYSTALLLYTMIAGRGPYDHLETAIEVFRAQIVTPPPRLGAFAEGSLPPELDKVVAKALQKDPAARFQTADEFREALERAVLAPTKPLTAAESGRDPDGAPWGDGGVDSTKPEPSQRADSDTARESRSNVARARDGHIEKARKVVGLLTVFVLAASVAAIVARSIMILIAGRLS